MPVCRYGSILDPEHSQGTGKKRQPGNGADVSASEGVLASEFSAAHEGETRPGLDPSNTRAIDWGSDAEWVPFDEFYADFSDSSPEPDVAKDMEFSPEDFNLVEAISGRARSAECLPQPMDPCHEQSPEDAEPATCARSEGPGAAVSGGDPVPPIEHRETSVTPSCEKIPPPAEHRPIERQEVSRGPRRFRVLAAIVVIAAVIGALWYCGGSVERYRVETNILYLNSGPDPLAAKPWSWDEEVGLLTSPQLLCLVAQDFFGTRGSSLGKRSSGPVAHGADGLRPPYRLAAVSREVADVGPFVKWLSQELSVNAKPGNGLVSIGLQGENPKFLKAVLTSYLNQYQPYRRQLMQRRYEEKARTEAAKNDAERQAALKNLRDELAKLDSQMAGCKNVLEAMKTGRGSFSGFLPADGSVGIPSLDDFQKKIVELEMSKRALAVRFLPRSREITAVQREITGIRQAMRDRISEHLQFLQNKKHILLVKQNELATVRPQTAGVTAGPVGRGPGDLSDSGTGASVQDGLYLLEKPHVSHVPLTASAGDYLNRLVCGVSSGARAALGWTEQELTSFPFSCSLDIQPTLVQQRPEETNGSGDASPQVTEIIKRKLASVAKGFMTRVEGGR